MKYAETFEGIVYDSLLGGTTMPVRVENVSLASGEYERGTLLAKGSNGYEAVNGSDMDQALAILRKDIGSDEPRIAQVYTSGEFNREAIIVGSSIDLEEYKENLRREGIYLTSMKEGN